MITNLVIGIICFVVGGGVGCYLWVRDAETAPRCWNPLHDQNNWSYGRRVICPKCSAYVKLNYRTINAMGGPSGMEDVKVFEAEVPIVPKEKQDLAPRNPKGEYVDTYYARRMPKSIPDMPRGMVCPPRESHDAARKALAEAKL